MAEEEKQDQQPAEQPAEPGDATNEEAASEPVETSKTADTDPAPDPEAAEAPAAEAPAEPVADAEAGSAPEPAEKPGAETEAAPAQAAAPAAPAQADEPQLGPKERRKLARSRASGEAGPPRSTGDRIAERAEARRSKAAERHRWRAKQRTKRAATAGERTAQAPGAEAEPGKRKVRQGIVVSNKGEKTITVRIDSARRHRVYKKVVRESGRLHVHDESNSAGEGDLVRVIECRPLSRTKRWRLIEILEKAK